MADGFQLLVARLAELKADGTGYLTLRRVAWDDNNGVVLGIEVHEVDSSSAKLRSRRVENWNLHCRDVRDSRLVHVHGLLGIGLEERHTVLLPYTSPIVEIYFRGTCPDAHGVVGQLLQAHVDAVGTWFDFTRFLNVGGGSSPAEMLRGRFGRLAAGPQELMARYADVLRRNGFDVSSPPPTEPEWRTRRVRGETVIETEPPRVLLLNSCFVVTPQVTAKRA